MVWIISRRGCTNFELFLADLTLQFYELLFPKAYESFLARGWLRRRQSVIPLVWWALSCANYYLALTLNTSQTGWFMVHTHVFLIIFWFYSEPLGLFTYRSLQNLSEGVCGAGEGVEFSMLQSSGNLKYTYFWWCHVYKSHEGRNQEAKVTARWGHRDSMIPSLSDPRKLNSRC